MEIRNIFIYIWYVRPHFSSAGMVLCNVGGVKCQPFIKHSYHCVETALKCLKMELCALVSVEHPVFWLQRYSCSDNKLFST